jgi:hypothetical protein
MLNYGTGFIIEFRESKLIGPSTAGTEVTKAKVIKNEIRHITVHLLNGFEYSLL